MVSLNISLSLLSSRPDSGGANGPRCAGKDRREKAARRVQWGWAPRSISRTITSLLSKISPPLWRRGRSRAAGPRPRARGLSQTNVCARVWRARRLLASSLSQPFTESFSKAMGLRNSCRHTSTISPSAFHSTVRPTAKRRTAPRQALHRRPRAGQFDPIRRREIGRTSRHRCEPSDGRVRSAVLDCSRIVRSGLSDCRNSRRQPMRSTNMARAMRVASPILAIWFPADVDGARI
jgi:hypothetical protein